MRMVFEFHDVPGDGHCFFRATACLLRRARLFAKLFIAWNAADGTYDVQFKSRLSDALALRRLLRARMESTADAEARSIVRGAIRQARASGFMAQNSALEAVLEKDGAKTRLPDKVAKAVGDTNCYATELEFALMASTLRRLGLMLLNVLPKELESFETFRRRLGTLVEAQALDVDSTRLALLSTDDVHYQWVTVVHRGQERAVVELSALMPA